MFQSKLRVSWGLTGLGFVAALFSSGCGAMGFVPLATATSTTTQEFRTSDSPLIVIETFNGSIDVSEGNVDEVVVEVTKHAGGFDRETAEANLERIELSFHQKDNTIHVSARQIGRSPGNLGASMVIVAPKSARLQLRSSNGYIVCEGLRGDIDATTSNAKVEVVEATGKIDLNTSNGPIEIEAVNALIDARTSNARIVFDGSLAGKEQKFHTSNAKIELVLPADSQFRVAASTSNSKIRCDFPVATEGKARRTKLKGVVGENPIGLLDVSTSNGPIEIRQAKKPSVH